MAAKPPPARPHIGLHSSFNARSNADWGEDDVWDSGSDSESPRQSTISNSWRLPPSPSSYRRQSSPITAPKPVPRPPSNSSSSNVSFSYTHLSAPSPGSYPSNAADTTQPAKGGWTMVRKSGTSQDALCVKLPKDIDPNGDVDVDSDMVVGDFEPEMEQAAGTSIKVKPDQGSIKSDVIEIMNDPLHRFLRSPQPQPEPRFNHRMGHSPRSSDAEKLLRESSIRTNRRIKFIDCLSKDDVNISELRKLAWAGTPNDLRAAVWPILLGYLPLPSNLRASTLARKRGEYSSLVELAFARDRQGLDQQIWHQIEIDVPRTRPGVRLWMQASTQRSLERILYVWAIRHPASGYVQGINDLVTPFFQVFLSAYIESDPEEFDTSLLPTAVLSAVEADSFWCLSRLLDGIQDNYISAQPGIQRSVKRMAELVARIDAPLYTHLESQNVEFMQFAFRWMNCLLMREISVKNTIRMWDTYLAEGADAFSQFHLYVCSAFLVKWSEKLRQMDFQGIIMFLQSLPTQDWGDHEIEMLLSEAFVLNSIWHNAQSHFNAK
ncbi:rab-GTPase-TBC domain-containing protein [Suillus plorans]|uniref:Rab-GTPase-TBC domain-containing protein n=1 Tax=Suillus plorans TaxID=116603 RepID=A0A9P7DP74_9AGAM|nr:rab-GTPase-TBC domain-containing protein [Suillus plorans]KAG1799746.1 rab-GTPase-TBC domain-containing protein [Suillus plorans]